MMHVSHLLLQCVKLGSKHRLPVVAPNLGSMNLVARGWFYVAIGDVATVNFTHCNSIMHSNAEK